MRGPGDHIGSGPVVKSVHNNPDIVRRALISVSMNAEMNTTLYDIKSMSFKMGGET